MDVIYPRCAGLDVHKQTVVACARIAGAGAAHRQRRQSPGLARALGDWWCLVAPANPV